MSLQINDLKDLVQDTVHIDEYQSKMGDDSDVIVVSLKVKYYDPAWELSNYIEKGYDWVLDADVSSGEMEDGGYLVFVESLRRPSFPDNLIKMLEDMEGITGNDPAKYDFAYRKGDDYQQLTADALRSTIPLSPRQYKEMYPDVKSDEDKALESLQMAAGLTPKSKPVTDPAIKEFVNLSKR